MKIFVKAPIPLFLVIVALASCNSFMSTPIANPTETATSTTFLPLTATSTATLQPTNSNTELTPTGESYVDSIEVIHGLESSSMVDHVGNYLLTFSENWILGPLHSDFASIVEKESRTNERVRRFFEHYLQTKENIRAFGFSISPTQLNKDSFAIVTIGTFELDRVPWKTVDELADKFVTRLNPELVTFTYRSEPSTSEFDVPTLIMLYETQGENGKIAFYNGVLSARLESVFVQVIISTNNPKINLREELALPASTIMNYDK